MGSSHTSSTTKAHQQGGGKGGAGAQLDAAGDDDAAGEGVDAARVLGSCPTHDEALKVRGQGCARVVLGTLSLCASVRWPRPPPRAS